MTPTPLYRPRSISVSKRVFWTLTTISAGLRGDSPLKPELTADGIADDLLTKAIETRFPGLLEQYSQREKFDTDAIKMVTEAASEQIARLGARDAKHDAAVLRAKEGQA